MYWNTIKNINLYMKYKYNMHNNIGNPRHLYAFFFRTGCKELFSAFNFWMLEKSVASTQQKRQRNWHHLHWSLRPKMNKQIRFASHQIKASVDWWRFFELEVWSRADKDTRDKFFSHWLRRSIKKRWEYQRISTIYIDGWLVKNDG